MAFFPTSSTTISGCWGTGLLGFWVLGRGGDSTLSWQTALHQERCSRPHQSRTLRQMLLIARARDFCPVLDVLRFMIQVAPWQPNSDRYGNRCWGLFDSQAL